MFCPVCLRTSYCPCKACVERNPNDFPRYEKINMREDKNDWDEKCPHCGYTASVHWWEDYDYRMAGYYNGTGILGDIDLEKAKTNIYSSNISINRILEKVLENLEKNE